MKFLKNAWHMIGWAEELQHGAFVHRTVAEQPILVYRLEDGSLGALADRCPHRFVPLHLGRQVGDVVQCGYHGLCFDKGGACVKNPVDGAPIPKAARVRSYPALERHGGLWVWPGDPAQADASKLPDYAFLDDTRRAVVRGHMATAANYQLAIDNLTDLTHLQFVHADSQASEVFAQLKNEVRQEGDTVTTMLTFPNGKAPLAFGNALADPEARVDIVYEVRWNAPSCAKLTVRGHAPGERGRALFDVQSAHIVTAESATTCHYFFANSRDYAVGDAAVDARVREWQRVGFAEQDKPMLEAQQRAVGDADILSLGPVLLGTDAGSVRVRRTLKALLEAEAGAAA